VTQINLLLTKPTKKPVFIVRTPSNTHCYSVTPVSVSQPDDVVTVSRLTSFSAAAAAADDDDDDDEADFAGDAGDDTGQSANIVRMVVRCDVVDSSDEKSMTSSRGLMTSRSRACRMRLTGSTSRNCTNPRLKARSAAAIFAFCFVKPTPSNVCKRKILDADTNECHLIKHGQPTLDARHVVLSFDLLSM